ncbi:hypothetical protein QW060_17190 [Myroides ceti]|uniref:Uncharacterized protein n=1 Tax=Paenimyroides ceti TaxID=395087 RepID=A0ABT8CWE1_9FLAO|nr:hypothetical protein [Paenimyroides ceti]MDN3708838.1 hypothetical protein [Paenimyroides ceti]
MLEQNEKEVAISHVSNILGRTFSEINSIYDQFAVLENPDRFLHIIYWLGKLAIDEVVYNNKRTITFSPILRERLGHHIYGEIWADNIKNALKELNLLQRPIHIISANMHSVMNSIFAVPVLKSRLKDKIDIEIYEELSKSENDVLRKVVKERADREGMLFLPDTSGTNIDVQLFDTAKIDPETSTLVHALKENLTKKNLLILLWIMPSESRLMKRLTSCLNRLKKMYI